MSGTKHDESKAQMELLSHAALEQIAHVMGFGAKKYGIFNYRGGIAYGRIIGAAYRHLGAFNSGEDLDPETGLSHIAHLGACSLMLLDMLREHPDLDTRYKGSKAGDMTSFKGGTQKVEVGANVKLPPLACHYCNCLSVMMDHQAPAAHYSTCEEYCGKE